MNSLEAELAVARDLDVEDIAVAVRSVGFECTRCGACCTAEDGGPHTATVFPEEIRRLQAATGRDWDEVARPMPFGLDDEGHGETFEWALQIDENGDCTFYEEENGVGQCTVHESRPLICRTYPFAISVGDGVDAPGAVVDHVGDLQIHECPGLGGPIGQSAARDLAETLERRAVTELEEAIAVRDSYEPVSGGPTVVHDSEGAKRPDGTPLRPAGDNY